ncbi:MAG: Z1 domain-containing protein [Betaproteobacteria bacterium]
MAMDAGHLPTGACQETEIVEVLPQALATVGGSWIPIVGPETAALLRSVPAESRDTVLREAVAVLARCISPREESGRETGLVVGYVQSGKTMSFTTVSALARDNGYQMVIVITGTSINLFRQSNDRLQSDLHLVRRGSGWRSFRSDRLNDSARQSIQSALARWRDDTVRPDERQTVFITVMKQRTHLDRLIRLLRALDLRNVPALIIDDEADQASLNNLVRKGDQSATYRRLVALRDLFPLHTYLQYTATPQAPLLINIIDALSPGFAQVLTPGPAYTGGITFFEQNLQLVRVIPEQDVPTDELSLLEPPETLLQAMRTFFLGVAADIVAPEQHNRSMMVHPSKATTQHQDYCHWVNSIKAEWQRTLELPADDPDRNDLVQDFQAAYDDLAKTVGYGLAPFDELMAVLHRAIRETVVTEVNARQTITPEIDWERDNYHILVGGQALDRGYTVEGLTVTYMPRGRGVGNADTIQQRARWFGYKAEYLGYCRVYLAPETLEAYRGYVQHEEDIRRRLREHTGSLREWRRAFFLSPNLSPTRNSVLNLDYMRGNFTNRWFEVRSPHVSDEAIQENRTLVQAFRNRHQFVPDEGDLRRLPTHHHIVATNIPLGEVLQQLLIPFRVTHPNDSNRMLGFLLQVQRYHEFNPRATCTVYIMSPNVPRERGVDENGEIAQLFQGPHPDKNGEIYPGDRGVRAPEGLTVQIHLLQTVHDRGNQALAHDVPVLAAWVPEEMSADWVTQNQGGAR